MNYFYSMISWKERTSQCIGGNCGHVTGGQWFEVWAMESTSYKFKIRLPTKDP
jgi:hypothetical protein